MKYNILLPNNKKSMESFLEKINFVRRSVPNFTQIVLPLQNMIKKNNSFKWNNLENNAFNYIKHAIIDAPPLLSPNYEK